MAACTLIILDGIGVLAERLRPMPLPLLAPPRWTVFLNDTRIASLPPLVWLSDCQMAKWATPKSVT